MREYSSQLQDYEGAIDGLHPMVVVKGMNDVRWNYAMPRPLVDDETIHVHPDQSGVSAPYVRVVMSSPKGLVHAVYSKYEFTRDSWPDFLRAENKSL